MAGYRDNEESFWSQGMTVVREETGAKIYVDTDGTFHATVAGTHKKNRAIAPLLKALRTMGGGAARCLQVYEFRNFRQERCYAEVRIVMYNRRGQPVDDKGAAQGKYDKLYLYDPEAAAELDRVQETLNALIEERARIVNGLTLLTEATLDRAKLADRVMDGIDRADGTGKYAPQEAAE